MIIQSPPICGGTVGIIYNKEMVDDEVDSWGGYPMEWEIQRADFNVR